MPVNHGVDSGALSDALPNPNTLGYGAYNVLWDPTANGGNGAWLRQPTIARITTAAQGGLISALRTATTSGTDQVNIGWKGIHLFLNVTVASGTGGLVLRIQGKDPISGNYVNLNAAPTAVIAVSTNHYILYPGATAGGTQATAGYLSGDWRIQVTPGDSTNYTYSVGGFLLP